MAVILVFLLCIVLKGSYIISCCCVTFLRTYAMLHKAVADGPVGPVLAGPTFYSRQNHYTRQVINKRKVLGLILAMIGLLYYSTANREAILRVGRLSAAHASDLFQCSQVEN